MRGMIMFFFFKNSNCEFDLGPTVLSKKYTQHLCEVILNQFINDWGRAMAIFLKLTIEILTYNIQC